MSPVGWATARILPPFRVGKIVGASQSSLRRLRKLVCAAHTVDYKSDDFVHPTWKRVAV